MISALTFDMTLLRLCTFPHPFSNVTVFFSALSCMPFSSNNLLLLVIPTQLRSPALVNKLLSWINWSQISTNMISSLLHKSLTRSLIPSLLLRMRGATSCLSSNPHIAKRLDCPSATSCVGSHGCVTRQLDISLLNNAKSRCLMIAGIWFQVCIFRHWTWYSNATRVAKEISDIPVDWKILQRCSVFRSVEFFVIVVQLRLRIKSKKFTRCNFTGFHHEKLSDETLLTSIQWQSPMGSMC